MTTLCRTAPLVFVCLDYDGTLVPIAARPEEARPGPALLALLTRLTQTPHLRVAVVSGRPLAQLQTLLPVPGLTYIGTHGLEVRTPSGEHSLLLPPGAFTTIISQLRRKLATRIDGLPGFLLEDKRYALALHYRLAPPSAAEGVVADFLSQVRTYQRRGIALNIIHGKKVVEVRPLGVNKGKAVQALLTNWPRTSLCLYVGDDTTDEDAFQALLGHGYGILVARTHQPTSAQYYLRDPEEVTQFLSHLIEWRQESNAHG
ncbi:MAG: trehalose-phosphatase [Candidatus Binatia bacterium]